jgi:Mrp family chromosome partitioning ATPase
MFSDQLQPGVDHGGNSPYRGLIYRIFQPRRDSLQGVAIAVTSPNRGAGTSYVVQSLATELGSYPGNRVLSVDLVTLASTLRSDLQIMELITATENQSVCEIRRALSSVNGHEPANWWHAGLENRGHSIDRLRETFQYVIFDCPAVLESGEALGIAPLVDGFLLVVEADRTTREDVAQAETQIESAGGRIYGSILNKLKPGISDWVQRKG